MARQKATSVMVDLLSTALAAGHKAKYVLFDSWFSSPQLKLSKRDIEDDRTLGELFYIMISEVAGVNVAPIAGGLEMLYLEIYGFQGAVSIFCVRSLSSKNMVMQLKRPLTMIG